MIQSIIEKKIMYPINFRSRLIVKRRKFKYNDTAFFLALFVTIFSIVVSGITFTYKDSAPEGYEFMWLLPLIYGILFYCTNIRYALFKYLGISLLSVILFIRYLILPLFFSLTGLYFHSASFPTGNDVNLLAIFLMIYEMMCIFLVMHYFIKRLSELQTYKHDINTSNYDSKYFIYIIVILIGIISLLLIPAIQLRTNFLIINDNFERVEMNALSYICFLFTINTFKVLFILVLIIAYKKMLNGRHYSQLLIILFAFLSISFFWTTNRLTVLAQGIATVVLLKSSNLINKKFLYILIIIPILTVFSISSYRWFGFGMYSGVLLDMESYLDVMQMSNYLMAYFAGPHLISLAITAEYNLSFPTLIQTFAEEILSSIIFVQQIFPLSNYSTTLFFNRLFRFFWEPSFIVPTLGQSYMYFGGLFAPLLSIVFSFFIFKAEKALIMSETMGEKYAYYILLCWLAFFPLQNVNIVASYICNIFFPFYLIVKVNKKISL